MKEIPPNEQNLGQCALFTLLGRRKDQTFDYILIHRIWPMIWLYGHGLGRNRIKKISEKEFWERII